jgi:multidrug resistance efflux pump
MIASLRERRRADRFRNDVRGRQKKKVGRWIYVGLVVGFFAWLANALVGPQLWLRAEGLVNAERIIIGSPHESQVVEIDVRPGEYVKKGQLLAKVNSPQVTDALAMLSARYAETYARQAELAVRGEVAKELSRYAAERARESQASFDKIKQLRGPGVVSVATWTAAQQERYTAMEEQVTREAEQRSSAEQVRNLAAVQAEARSAMVQLEQEYHGGVVQAPEDGIVGANVARRGDVVKPGDYVTELFVGVRNVLAYLDTGTWYKVKVGERVWVSDGFQTQHGTVAGILPMAVQLPPEFQKVFHPAGRGQVARIELDEPDLFPLMSKVRITGEGYVPGRAWYDAHLRPAVDAYVVPVASRIDDIAGETVRGAWRQVRRLLPTL